MTYLPPLQFGAVVEAPRFLTAISAQRVVSCVVQISWRDDLVDAVSEVPELHVGTAWALGSSRSTYLVSLHACTRHATWGCSKLRATNGPPLDSGWVRVGTRRASQLRRRRPWRLPPTGGFARTAQVLL